MRPAAFLVFLGALLASQPAVAQTVQYVDNIGTCDGLTPCSSTIMDAVNAAASGDSIEVFPGVYHEAVVFEGKGNIVLRGHVEALRPVIAAPDGKDAVSILATPDVQVLNFVLVAPEGAGVMALAGASRNTVIHGNLVKALRGISLAVSVSCMVSNNTVLGGGIMLRGASGCLVDGNTVNDASIGLGEFLIAVRNNLIQRNVVRRGGISLGFTDYGGGANIVESNFVSGSSGNGLQINAVSTSGNIVQNNTSIENAGCDISDHEFRGGRNIWSSNRFGTKCGAATE